MTLVRSSPRASERGTALLAALCFAAVLTVAMGSYMTVCYRTLEMSSRTLQSTQCVELAEAGMEEALWSLNKDDWSGWTIAGTTATKTLGGFTYDSGATGQVNLTVTSYDGSAGTRTVTATGETTAANGTTVRRTLTSTSQKAPLFVNAIAATTGRVRFRAAGTVDSYDSSQAPYSPGTAGHSAVVSSGSTSITSATVQMASAEIKGYVATVSTGPSYASAAILVGPASPAGTKIDSSRISTSPYQPVFSEIAPTGTSTLLPTGPAPIGTPGATTPALYHATNVILYSEVLTIDGPVVLTVTGDLRIYDTAKIKITGTGSIEIHLAGDLTISGNGIENDTLLPRNFAIIGTAEYETLAMTTNTPFHGVIYAPKASFTVNNNQAIHGSIIAKAVTFNGSPAFHYDVSLRQAVFPGIDTPYAISDWRETTNGN